MPKVYGLQWDIAWEDKPANFARIDRLLGGAGIEAGSLVVLPEMFSTGFSMNVGAIAEGQAKPAEAYLQSVARRYGVHMLGGVVNVGDDGWGRNQAVVYAPDGAEICRYDKIHPFTLGGESAHYAAGGRIEMFDWGGMKVCPLICYDLRFPEVFRAAVRMGAQAFVVIANWPNRRENHWTTLLAARAIENQAYVIGVNRSGTDPSHVYSGRSMIIDPHGAILADGGNDEGIIDAELRREIVTKWRDEFPALNDMTHS